ncbi:hypothetical protein PG997_015291 [Apiospora hydei]|uniref:Knr4/Smi1-like domain-containing protein n=1 Tax=Apiospora hydei TaxID=1337664 RepID=A0ABR1USR7_9PEZI
MSSSAYSHDETVAAITSYYKLVSKVHAITRNSTLLFPPPEGWPELGRAEVAAGLGFSDEVMRLLRHIPYFEDSEAVQILPDVQPHSYIEPQRIELYAELGKRSSAAGEGEETPKPLPYLVSLGCNAPDREYGHDVWLDTKRGIVLVGSYHDVRPDIGVPEDGIFSSSDDDNNNEGDYEDLFTEYGQKGSGRSWRVGTFFAACERNLRELMWMPGMDEGDEGWMLDKGESPYAILDYEERMRIMRSKGWPGDSWDPEAVADEVDRLLSE